MRADRKLAIFEAPKIEPDLKEFIDEVLVPMLVRDALRELSAENHLALGLSGWITCKENRNGGRGKPGSQTPDAQPDAGRPDSTSSRRA